jgi:DNA polymerase-3 subunit gamma/tau
LAGEIQTTLALLNELAQGGKDLGRLLGDLLNHFRNLLIYQVSRGDLNLVEASEAEVAALKEQSSLSSTDALTRILETLADAELRLRDATSKKILLEVTLLRAIEARNAVPIDSVLKQLNQLRGHAIPSAVAPPAAPAQPARIAPPVPAAAPKRQETTAASPIKQPAPAAPISTAATSGSLAELWRNLLDAVSKASPFVYSYLTNAHPISFEKDIFVIGFDPEFEDQISLVDHSRNHALLTTKLAELGRHNAMIKFVKAEAPVGWERPSATPVANSTPPSAAKPASVAKATETAETGAAPAAEKKTAPVAFNKEEFKNDPLIKKALDIFKGTIVEVRA